MHDEKFMYVVKQGDAYYHYFTAEELGLGVAALMQNIGTPLEVKSFDINDPRASKMLWAMADRLDPSPPDVEATPTEG